MVDSTEYAGEPASRLEGWKAIAAYLSRDVRTAKRWEASEELPVHRHHHSERSSVYAFPQELDAWRSNRRPQPTGSSSVLHRRRRALMLAPLMLTALLTAGGGHVRTVAGAAIQGSSDAQEVLRKVGRGGVMSRDGRRLVYNDPNGNPVLHDIATGADRPLTTGASYGGSWAADRPVISRDGRQLAYWWANNDKREGARGAEIRLANLDGVPSPRMLLVVNEDIYPHDWSPDGRWIALAGPFGISVVSTADGSRRRVHTLNGRSPDGVFFSPNGRYLAFDAYADQVTDSFDIFILPLDGSGAPTAVRSPAHDRIMDWSPDGRHLLFASDRSGSVDLWALPVAAGKPDGNARMIRRGLDFRRSFGLGANGGLFISVSFPDRDVQVVAIDLESGRTSTPVRPIQQFVGMNEQPAWSRDGKRLAYVSRRDREPFPVIAIRSEDTGEVRELRPNLPNLRGINWAPNGQELLVGGHDLRDEGVMVRIDVRSGAVTRLLMEKGGFAGFFAQWSLDGSRIYYRKPPDPARDGALVERDLASGRERELIGARLDGHSLSPDGQWIAGSHSQRGLILVAVSSGEVRALSNAPALRRGNGMAWAPNGRAVILKGRHSAEDDESLWLVPTDGTPSRKLDVDVRKMAPPAFSGIAMHPDGKRLAFVSDGESRSEVWVLERFLPALAQPAK